MNGPEMALISAKKKMVRALLYLIYAEVSNLNYKRFCHSLHLHHHGEGETAHLSSAKKCRADGVALFYRVASPWRPMKVGRQFHLCDMAASLFSSAGWSEKTQRLARLTVPLGIR
jgi:hypothetical protein